MTRPKDSADRLQVVSIKLPVSTLRKIPGNRSSFVRDAVAEKLARQRMPAWQPKTSLGRKLQRLRNEFLSAGGELLDADGIAAELRSRRNGAFHAAAAIRLGAQEFITTESPEKPIFRVTELKVRNLLQV